jgi:hypothetical protein
LNAATGAITASLNFNNGDFMQTLVGRYLYKLSSPAGHFLPLTNSFTVTNFPFAQKFTGNVVSNSTSVALSNALVVLFPAPRPGHNGPGQPLGGTVANSAGTYTIAAPAGTYTVVAFYTNYVSSLKKSPVLTLSSSTTITTNLTVTNATASITGSLVDAANPAIGLPGVFMPLNSTDGLLALAFSDTNGNFNARVTAGQWSIGSDDTGLIIHGYVGYQNGSNVNSGATGVTLPFPKASALFYGRVVDGLGNPLVGIDVNDYDTSSNLYSMDGYTDVNGNYYVGALGLGSSDPWQLGLSSESLSALPNAIASLAPLDSNNGTNLTAGTAVLQNFTILAGTNTISGNVKDTGNNPITNVQVYAYATIGGVGFMSETNTDSNGNYVVNVTNGTWNVNVYCGGGNNSLPSGYQCPNSIMVNIANNNAVTNFVIQPCAGVSITTMPILPVGEVGINYYQTFSAASCYPSFTWTNTSGGSALPLGLTFYSNGQLSGLPTANGVYLFNIQVKDGNNNSISQQFSLTIYTAVQVTTTALPNGTNGFFYSQQLQAAGGQIFGGPSPYSWSLSPGSPSLPPNLTLATNGILSGLAATNGTFNFSVRVTDNVGSTFDQPFNLTLNSTSGGTPPPVGIASVGGQVLIYYPLSGSGFTLQTATNLAGPWVPATGGVPVNALTFSNTVSAQFYRLH